MDKQNVTVYALEYYSAIGKTKRKIQIYVVIWMYLNNMISERSQIQKIKNMIPVV